MNIAQLIVHVLLEEAHPPSVRNIIEASVHLGTRSKTFTASFRDRTGKQRWRSTKLTDPAAALKLAQDWEEREKRARPAHPLPAPPPKRVRGLLSYAEVAAILDVSERTVRADEAAAFAKLRNHPKLKELWNQWLGLPEGLSRRSPDLELTAREVGLILRLAMTPLELRALQKLIALTGAVG